MTEAEELGRHLTARFEELFAGESIGDGDGITEEFELFLRYCISKMKTLSLHELDPYIPATLYREIREYH